ncbi:hypothetical protein BJY01DRAFT_204720 [Aspergillus pseudoustus]|uniref:PARP-type domain-containing protein n=1 Tax=Aspergillus pseudoustus TaxID=1810923 RepID=A0ABR4KRR6_9EURO
MPTYRIEESPTNRAGCQNKECKDAKIKIKKGEIRVGSWVDTEKVQAFMWRHWGCVTPKMLSNMNEVVGEGDDRDLDLLDGYEDLSEENQEKLVRALDQGHVDDEDWKGDVEMNRPGKFGFRVRGGKKKAADASDEEKEKDEESEEKPKKASKPRKRSRFDVEEDEDEEEKPKPKRKATGYPKYVPPASDDDDEGADKERTPAKTKPKAAKRGSKPKDEGAAAPAAKGAKRTKKTDDDAEDEPVAEKPKRGRRKKST